MESSALILPAFLAGILTFLAPCTLPLVPGFLAFISGTSAEELADPKKSRRVHRKIFLNALLYVLGFSLIFVFFGVLVGIVGQSPSFFGADVGTVTAFRRIVARVGGLFVIFFGLFLAGAFTKVRWLSGLQSEKRPRLQKLLKPGHPGSSFLFGATFAFGWTPCIGPILGSILLLAGTTGSVSEGAMLLSIFSLGLALPFLILAAATGAATGWIKAINRYLSLISKIGGVFLIIIGALMLFNVTGIFYSWTYRFFGGLGYEKLLDYL